MALTNPLHIAFIAVVALLVLGPKRLPEIAKSLGKGMRDFREALTTDHADQPPAPVAVEPPPPPAPVAVEPPPPPPPPAPVGPPPPPSPST